MGRYRKALYPTLAGIFYLAYTLVLLYPVSLNIRTLLPGYATDTYQHVWISWWYRYSLTDLHINPNNLVMLFAPDGMQNPLIWASPLPHLIALPLQYLLGTIGAFNFMYIISFPLCGLAMYALAYDLTSNHAGAFVAGFIFAFFPNKTVHLVGHYLQFHTYWLPLYVLFLLRLLKQATWKNAVLCGVFLGLSVLSHLIHAAQFVLPVTVLILAWALLSKQKVLQASVVTRLAASFAIALVIVLPFYGPYVFSTRRYELEMVAGGVSVYSLDLLNFVVPHIWHPLSSLLPSLYQKNLDLVPAGGYFVESVGYAGIIALLAAFWGFISNRKQTLLWVVIALTGAILALGPLLHVNGQLVSIAVDDKSTYLPLPYLIINKLPLLNVGRTPGRTAMLAMFGVAVLAAFGVSQLKLVKQRWLARGTLVLLTLLMAFDYMIWPLPYFESPVPAFFEQLRDKPGGAVLNFPSFLLDDAQLVDAPNQGLVDQMTHLRPINSGYLHRWDPVLRSKTLALDELIMPERDAEIIDYDANNDLAGLLQQTGYEYVVIRKPYSDAMPADVKSQYLAYELKGATPWPEQVEGNAIVYNALGDPVFEDQSVWIYQVPAAKPNSAGSAWLYLGSGWGWVSRVGGVPTRKLVGIGEIYIEPLLPGNGALAFDATADKDTTLILTHADQAIGSCSLAANVSATCVVAPFALQQGANKLSLAAAPGSAPASITISHLAYHFDQ